MIRPAGRVVAALLTGAALGALALICVVSARPVLVFEMDRDLPRSVGSGFYPVERSGETTFAWTSRRADVTLAGFSRRSPWTCAARIRGGRADPATQPTVTVAVDGLTVTAVTAGNEFEDVPIAIPPRESNGVVVSLASSRTIVPGTSDTRELGIQVDRLACRADSRGVVFPPTAAIRSAALGAAIFSAALALAGFGAAGVALGTAVIAVAQAYPLATGLAAYTSLPSSMLWVALWATGLALILLSAIEKRTAHAPSAAARFVPLFSAAALYLKLYALLHPSKLLVDAVFHAHRFEWVLGGRYFFTQGMPGGVSFPYAIGLYVFAAPWSLVTHDYVTLLRVVVCSAEVIAGALLYPLIVKAWDDRAAGAAAVVLFNVVPLPYGLVGNANLTNAFGQSVALAALVSASMLPARAQLVASASGLFLLCSLAFLSHVSTFALLVVTLSGLVLVYWMRGGLGLRRTARVILGVTATAALFAVVVYYGHFGEVYKAALRVRGGGAGAAAAAAPSPGGLSSSAVPVSGRIANAVTFTVAAIGWPILLLGVGGVVRLWSGGMRDRAALLVAAWTIAYLVFLGVAVMRVDAPFQRYAAEFVGRVLFATYPAAVVLAAAGAGWGWRAGRVPRSLSALLLLSAVLVGVRHWAGWIN